MKSQEENNMPRQDLICPLCGCGMRIRIQIGEHVNSATKKVMRHKYFQYFCEVCDTKDSGWTTTESDQLSIIYINKHGE